jgi:cell division protein FtsN
MGWIMALMSNRAIRALVIPTCAMRALILIAAVGTPVIPVAAQYAAVSPADPGTTLATSLRTLSTQPRNFQALVAAGRASLNLADTQAAAGFYGRAEEVSPQSPVPKIGMGAAMTAMGDARGAMTYFDRASALGAPQSLLALDRGLAFDLLGEQSKAQSDYRAAMFGANADEARRRLALSLAISKDIKGAAAMLEPLLARRDPAAVRMNAFVLALAGDREGARRTIDAALPGAGARFEPFFRLLPLLRPDEKAMAVHLGEFPKDAAQRTAAAGNRAETVPAVPRRVAEVHVTRPQRVANVEVTPPLQRVADVQVAPPRPVPEVQVTPPLNARQKTPVRIASNIPQTPRRALPEAAAPPPVTAVLQPTLGTSQTASKRNEPQGTPPARPEKVAEPDPEPRPEKLAELDPEPRPEPTSDELMPVAEQPEPLVPVNVGAVLNRDGEPVLSVEASLPPPPSTPKLEIKPPPAPKPKVELAKLDLSKAKAKPKAETEKPKPIAEKTKAKAEGEKTKEAARKKAEAEKAKEAALKKAATEKAREAARKKVPASPYFVQLASGANANRMGLEFKKIKAKKPALFAGRSAQVTNGKELFRLVVGPFKNRDDSGEFVNQLAKAGIDGFTYTAPDGMTFEKIATK